MICDYCKDEFIPQTSIDNLCIACEQALGD